MGICRGFIHRDFSNELSGDDRFKQFSQSSAERGPIRMPFDAPVDADGKCVKLEFGADILTLQLYWSIGFACVCLQFVYVLQIANVLFNVMKAHNN